MMPVRKLFHPERFALSPALVLAGWLTAIVWPGLELATRIPGNYLNTTT
jgi:hypothetical protein